MAIMNRASAGPGKTGPATHPKSALRRIMIGGGTPKLVLGVGRAEAVRP